jgi:TPR repeat protein
MRDGSSATSGPEDAIKVFISYSRDDLEFSDQLASALDLYGFACTLDRTGISAGEDWRQRLNGLIAEADTVVFVLSPSSARSEICAWEVEQARELSKRIVPVLCRPLEGAQPPQRLTQLDYIFFYHEAKALGSGFGSGLVRLVGALNTDLDWLRQHTRYLQRATEWAAGGRPINRLLSGSDIDEAKAWAARRPRTAPEPTTLQLDYFKASETEAEARNDAQRQQLAEMASAQAEREKALRQAEEAVVQVADAQRRRAFVRNVAFAVVSIAAVVAILLGLWANNERSRAELQRKAAEAARQTAVAILNDATDIITKSEALFDDATNRKAFSVFKRGADELGIPSAIYNTGLSLSSGRGVKQDVQLACDYYEKAAELGIAQAMTNLADCFARGRGRPQNNERSAYWYGKAAEKGYLLARLIAAEQRARDGTPPSESEISQLVRDAAASTDTDVTHKLAEMYERGSLLPKNQSEALRFYRACADAGRRDCMYSVGRFYANGFGVERNDGEAVKWIRQAADLGEPAALNDLGIRFESGRGVDQNGEQALAYYTKAADLGDLHAMENLGLVAQYGKFGGKRDPALARRWFERAAAGGLQSSMVRLADLEAAENNAAKAREWLEKAAALGNTTAKARLAEMDIMALFAAGKFAEALKAEIPHAAQVEAEEIARDGKPGFQTARDLNRVAWFALFARDFALALSSAERAAALLPNDPGVEANRAHALMMLDRTAEARKLYLARRGRPAAPGSGKTWETVIAEDFRELRQAGITHPLMAEVERELRVTH